MRTYTYIVSRSPMNFMRRSPKVCRISVGFEISVFFRQKWRILKEKVGIDLALWALQAQSVSFYQIYRVFSVAIANFFFWSFLGKNFNRICVLFTERQRCEKIPVQSEIVKCRCQFIESDVGRVGGFLRVTALFYRCTDVLRNARWI